MPIYRRLPKRGFKNPFRKEYAVLNVGNVEKAVKSGKLKAGAEVDETMLRELGLVGKKKLGVRLLAQGEISTKITLKVTGASKAAIAAVEGAGGTVELTGKSKKQ